MPKPLVVIDDSRKEIFVRGREVHFAPIERAILTALFKTRAALTREQLSDESGCCGGSFTSRTIDQHISRIRRKLKPHSDAIQTVPGHGYKIASAYL